MGAPKRLSYYATRSEERRRIFGYAAVTSDEGNDVDGVEPLQGAFSAACWVSPAAAHKTMIITKKKDTKNILEALKGLRSVFLFGCDTCAAQCSTGGKKELDEMKALLEENGIKVTGYCLPEVTCYRQYIVKEFKEHKEAASADAMLVLACGAGVRTVADVAPESTPVIPALDSLYLATVERFGRFLEGCAMCGDCVLADTGGICPHTECPKGLLNGPCGGVADGMCEVNTTEPCAWVRIYNRLKEQGRLHLMKKVRPPKSHANSVKPRKTFLRSYEREIGKKSWKK